ncbi:hypothetical protein [Colwellia psychrerythraea]|uniref:Lipoprotein n=1 Tax=Colwellia psychrerythraea TaxID=28229 RepID=A0A099KWX4_COLPS|nr:hypothetical protein [Colwellia psychrerythraea]KGJ95234.1 hypothetical protein GAB14E_2016 [Colwellia psychrerythraea]
MKVSTIKFFKNVIIVSLLVFCNLTSANNITVDKVNNYPYKNLINRTDDIKIFYITRDGSQTCNVEIILKNMKWTSIEMEVKKENFNDDILSNCLTKDKAEIILFQTFLQFGQGL